MAAFPQRPLGPLEVAVAERNAVALGVSVDTLMENAGRAIAEEATRHLPAPPARVAVLAGPGNNGGDGTCAVYYLTQWGYSPELFLLRPAAEIRTAAARRCFERVSGRVPVHLGVPSAATLREFPLLIDAMLGSGQTGDLRPPYDQAVVATQASDRPILSIDVPTGFSSSASLHARWTVALSVAKLGVPAAESGELVVREIGIPPEAFDRTGPGEFLFFPALERQPGGRTGRLLVVGGGPYAGAPALAALAALRAGAERATVAAPVPAASTIQAFSPNLVVLPLGSGILRPDDVPGILEFVDRANIRAVVLGMGAGADPRTIDAAGQLIRALEGSRPTCVDADALAAQTVLQAPAEGRDARRLVLTPNSGEWRHYFDMPSDGSSTARSDLVRHAAAERHATLILKGDVDLISDGESLVENRHHHPAMTVGGVGDVLAGVIGSLLAQGVSAFPAVRLASYWVGEAGQRAAGTRGPGLVATDVIDELPGALVDGLRRVRATG